MEVEEDTRYWLRPGKTYRAARVVEDFDFYLTHKRHSRKDAHFSLRAGSVDPKATLICNPDEYRMGPIYDVELYAETKSVWIAQPDGQDLEVKEGAGIAVTEGMTVKLLNKDTGESSIK